MYTSKLLVLLTLLVLFLGVSPYPQIHFQLGFYLLTMAVGVSLLIVIPPVMLNKRVALFNHSLVNMLLLLNVFGIVGALLTGNSIPRIIKEAAIFIAPVAFYFLLVNTFPIQREKSQNIFFKVLLITLITLCCLQLLYYPIGYLNFSSRYEFRHHYVLFSTVFLLLFPLSILNIEKKLVRFCLVVVFSLVIILTLSRDFQLYILLLLAAYLLYRWSKRLSYLYIICFCLFPFMYIGLATYMYQSGSIDKSSMWRFIELLSFAGHVLKNPAVLLTGDFFGSYLKTIEPIIIFGEAIDEIPRFHNFWLYLLFKFGLICTLAVYGTAIIYIYKLIRKSQLGYYTGFLLAYMLFVNGSFWGSFTQIPAVAILLAFILYISKKVTKDERSLYN